MTLDPHEVRSRAAYELWQAAGHSGDARNYWLQAGASAEEDAADSEQSRHLILVRHASRAYTIQPEKVQRMDGWARGEEPSRSLATDDGKGLRKSGWKKTLDIASSLADRLAVEGICVTNIFYSSHEAARQTAIVYASVLCRDRPLALQRLRLLDPEGVSRRRPKRVLAKLDKLWRCRVPAGSNAERKSRAIILVGHQPELSVLAGTVLGSGPVTLPLGGSEAACIRYVPRRRFRLSRRPRLRWLLTEKGDSLTAEVKDKVKSKVDTAKFFLGALAVNAGLLVNTTIWDKGGRQQWFVLAAGGFLIFLGLLFAIGTLSGYDALNMPATFWSESHRKAPRRGKRRDMDPPLRTVMRPPSEAAVLLFYEMVRVWRFFFIPALVCSVAGVSVFLLALLMVKDDALAGATTRANSPPPATISTASPPATPAAPAPPPSTTTGVPSPKTLSLPPPATFASPRPGISREQAATASASPLSTASAFSTTDVVTVVLQTPGPPKMNWQRWLAAAGGLTATALLVFLYYGRYGPKLGAED